MWLSKRTECANPKENHMPLCWELGLMPWCDRKQYTQYGDDNSNIKMQEALCARIVGFKKKDQIGLSTLLKIEVAPSYFFVVAKKFIKKNDKEDLPLTIVPNVN